MTISFHCSVRRYIKEEIPLSSRFLLVQIVFDGNYSLVWIREQRIKISLVVCYGYNMYVYMKRTRKFLMLPGVGIQEGTCLSFIKR